MPRIDFFIFFRYLLGIIVTVYATVVTLQSMRECMAFLAGSNKYTSLLRRYLVVHGLRLRVRRFWGDVFVCVLLCVVFLILWHAHHVVQDIGEKLRDVP